MLRGRLDELPDTERRIGQMLVEDVARLRALVEDLLEVSRLDSAPTIPDSFDVDLALYLRAVIADRYPAAQLRLPGPLRTVRIERLSLARIVGNLLDNARSHAPDASVTVQLRFVADEISIKVADDGPGVPAADLPLLFDRFYKADTSRQGGSGLGLAIAREHARRLGGELTVRPGPQRGLIFELRVPVTESLHSGDVAEKPILQPEGEHTDHTRSTS